MGRTGTSSVKVDDKDQDVGCGDLKKTAIDLRKFWCPLQQDLYDKHQGETVPVEARWLQIDKSCVQLPVATHGNIPREES